MAQQWPLPGQQGGDFVLSGPIPTSPLALIGPLTALTAGETGDWQGCCAVCLARVRGPRAAGVQKGPELCRKLAADSAQGRVTSEPGPSCELKLSINKE